MAPHDEAGHSAARWSSQALGPRIDTTRLTSVMGTPRLRRTPTLALLRHCDLSTGASVKQVQTVRVFDSTEVTRQTYGRLWLGDDDHSRSVINAIVGAAKDQIRTDGVVQLRLCTVTGIRDRDCLPCNAHK